MFSSKTLVWLFKKSYLQSKFCLLIIARFVLVSALLGGSSGRPWNVSFVHLSCINRLKGSYVRTIGWRNTEKSFLPLSCLFIKIIKYKVRPSDLNSSKSNQRFLRYRTSMWKNYRNFMLFSKKNILFSP